MQVHAAMHELSAAHREVIEQVHLRGRTYEELAALTGVPVATLRTRAYNGLLALRRTMESTGWTEWPHDRHDGEPDGPAGAPARADGSSRVRILRSPRNWSDSCRPIRTLPASSRSCVRPATMLPPAGSGVAFEATPSPDLESRVVDALSSPAKPPELVPAAAPTWTRPWALVAAGAALALVAGLGGWAIGQREPGVPTGHRGPSVPPNRSRPPASRVALTSTPRSWRTPGAPRPS